MAIAFILMTCKLGSEKDVLQILRAVPEVKSDFRVYGVYDFILQVEADTVESLRALIRKIRLMEKVNSTLFLLVI